MGVGQQYSLRTPRVTKTKTVQLARSKLRLCVESTMATHVPAPPLPAAGPK